MTGSTGPTGTNGPTGPIGQNAAISSVFAWSEVIQTNINVTKFQYVTFEHAPTGPTGYGWTTSIQNGYTHTTNFYAPVTGWYLLTYKIDVRSGSDSLTTPTDCATVLTQNGVQIPGSATLVEAPEENHIYTISNTVLSALNANDSVALLFWSNYSGTHIGDPTFLKGFLPGPSGATGPAPTEATASIVFTRISG